MDYAHRCLGTAAVIAILGFLVRYLSLQNCQGSQPADRYCSRTGLDRRRERYGLKIRLSNLVRIFLPASYTIRR